MMTAIAWTLWNNVIPNILLSISAFSESCIGLLSGRIERKRLSFCHSFVKYWPIFDNYLIDVLWCQFDFTKDSITSKMCHYTTL